MERQILRIAGTVLGYVAAFGVAGVILLFVLDIVFSYYTSGALFYAVWFVAGVFSGFLIYESAGSETVPAVNGSWGNHPDAARTGKLIVVVNALILMALSTAFRFLLWDGNWTSEEYVPENGPMTLTFFGTIFFTTLLARKTLAPRPAHRTGASDRV